MLSNFQLEDHALLQSFLVGQPEFREMMQRAEMQQLRQRVIASITSARSTCQETRGYIEHRLRHVGWNEDPRFEPGSFNAIYGHTGGIPAPSTPCATVCSSPPISARAMWSPRRRCAR